MLLSSGAKLTHHRVKQHRAPCIHGNSQPLSVREESMEGLKGQTAAFCRWHCPHRTGPRAGWVDASTPILTRLVSPAWRAGLLAAIGSAGAAPARWDPAVKSVAVSLEWAVVSWCSGKPRCLNDTARCPLCRQPCTPGGADPPGKRRWGKSGSHGGERGRATKTTLC